MMYDPKRFEEEQSSYVSPYREQPKQHNRSPYQQQSSKINDEPKHSTSIWQTNEETTYTPVKKYSHKMTTESNYERQRRQETLSREKEISLSVHKHFKDLDCDSRISNIEKINQKIKKILDTGSGVNQVKFKDI